MGKSTAAVARVRGLGVGLVANAGSSIQAVTFGCGPKEQRGPHRERPAGRLAGNALLSRCDQGARACISDGDENSANGCNGGTDEECDRGAPARADDHKALTVCAPPITDSTQRPPGERSMHLHGFRRDREGADTRRGPSTRHL